MMTPEEMTALSERVRAFLDAHQVEHIITLHASGYQPYVHLRDEDFARVFRGQEVRVTTDRGYDTLRGAGDGFDVIALRPMPMVLAPRVEVMP